MSDIVSDNAIRLRTGGHVGHCLVIFHPQLRSRMVEVLVMEQRPRPVFSARSVDVVGVGV